MKKISLLAAAAALVSFHASAANADPWNGAYVGAHTGYSWGKASQPYSLGVGGPLTQPQASPNLDGAIYGLQGGYNFVVAPNWVLGGEGVITWGDRKGDDGGSGGDVNGVNVKWDGSIRARGGYLFTPDLLVYGTVGWETMNVEATAPGHSVTHDLTGWTYGIGGEWAFNANWSGVVEWTHDDVSQKRFSFPVNGYDEGVKPDLDTLRVGVNWHF
jgi:outer membrane immunogenic protein